MYENYKRLACAVLHQAVKDYKTAISKHQYNKAVRDIKKIDDIWFQMSGVDKEWFYEKMLGVKKKK